MGASKDQRLERVEGLNGNKLRVHAMIKVCCFYFSCSVNKRNLLTHIHFENLY